MGDARWNRVAGLAIFGAVAAFGLASAGCSCDGESASGPKGGGPDGSVTEGGTSRTDGGAPLLVSCRIDLDCPPEQLCFGNACQVDPCATNNPCEGEDRCRAVCVDTVDPCFGVTCSAEETCVDGQCFAGCLPVVCEGKTCPAGQYCNPSDGACTAIRPCAGRCGSGAACHLTCTPRSACEGVTCEEGEFCRAGECIQNPCFGVSCSPGEVCQNGSCVETCACDPACTPPERCIANRCQCVPSCAPDAACGTPDGCGGFCSGTCPGSQDVCNPDTGQCDCIPACTDANCGDTDGCGGLCDGPCTGGLMCVDGACACTDQCLAASAVTCGEAIPATCMGTHACSGTGTDCRSGTGCVGNECCPNCAKARDIACGTPIPSPVGDTSGSACRSCSGVGSDCPSGQTCLNPPGTGAGTDRVCCGSCPAASSVACGTPIPDVRDGSGEVCRTCSGYGTSGCSGGQSCTGGSAGVCCQNCPGRNSVACGTEIPDNACRSCSGWGRSCPSGQSCRNPPGTSGQANRVCCGGCAGRSTVACGQDVPDVFNGGTLCRDCGVGTQCPAGESCTDGSCCPSCPSPSSVACGVPIPDQLNGRGEVCRTCATGTQCASGSSCIGGACCPRCDDASALSCGFDPSEPAGCPACPNGTMCAAGQRCTGAGCCAPTCTAPATRACGSTPSDGCGGTCTAGTLCADPEDTCTGNPPSCQCIPSCAGRSCGQGDGCGGECRGSCDPGFVCAERPPPASPGDYECEPSVCVPSCGLCEACILGTCEPLTCAPSESACLSTCECCPAGQSCGPTGCTGLI